MIRYSITKTNILFGVLLALLAYVPFAKAQQQSISSAGPIVTCPETNTMNICAPIGSPAAMKLEDFNPTDDNTPNAEIQFTMDEQIETLANVTVISRQYTFTDKDGNSSYCEMNYNIANRFIQAPAMDSQKRICQDDFFRGLKLGQANYMIYADDNGKLGNLIGQCDQPGLLCSAENLGINATEAGVSKLWVTEFISFPDASICESEGTLLNVEIIEKPTAQLSTNVYQAEAGTVLNLMDFVEENPTGFWNGQGVVSTFTADDSTNWLFSTSSESSSKLYYTVSNMICSQSYLLLVEPKTEPATDPLAGASVGLTINFNETQTVAIGNTSITFTAIEDSRCPKDVVCFWEGEAIATLEISNEMGSVEETFTVRGDCFPTQFCFGELKEVLGLNILLTGIHPYPVGDFNLNDDDDYTISLQVSSTTPLIITDAIDSPLIENDSSKEEDEAVLAAALADINTVTENTSCNNSSDWRFTSIAAICASKYITYSRQIDEVALLHSIQSYKFAFYEYYYKWNLFSNINCSDVIQPIPVSVICENGEPILNYDLLEPEPIEDPLSDALIGFTLNFNETKTFAIGNSSIKFIGLEDSRCQTEFNEPDSGIIECGWVGEASVTLEISNNLGTTVETFTMNGTCFPGRYGEFKEILGLPILLKDVSPYPVCVGSTVSNSINEEDYSVSFSIGNPVYNKNADSPLIDENTTQEQDQTLLANLLASIKATAENVSCENDGDWKYTDYGSKACGGPIDYIGYSTQIDEAAFLTSVKDYTMAEQEFNMKWSISSTCDYKIPPLNITCVDGEATLNYNPIEPPSYVNLGEQFTLNFDETKNIISEVEAISIKFLEIEDSRCPENVLCFHSGFAFATLEIVSDTSTELVKMGVKGLCDDNCGEQSISPEGYNIQLISVDPYPNSNENLEDSDYSVTLIIEKTSSFEEDLAALDTMFAEIKATAESIVCENAEDWKFTAYGSKACGGPQGYIAYSTQIDEAAFLADIFAHAQAEAEFNIKWGIFSTCDVPIPPQSISCVDGKAVFN